MSEDWRKYLVKSVCYAIAFFIANCVFFKLLIGQTNWLEMSIIWSLSYASGYFVGKTFRLTFEKAFTITVSILVILAFLFGVVLNMQDWYVIDIKLSWPFILSMYSYAGTDLLN